MHIYIIKRLLLIFPTLFLIILANFAIIQSAPGGPVEQAIAHIEQQNFHGATEQSGLSTSLGNDFDGNLNSNLSNNVNSKYLGSQGLSSEMVEAIERQYGFDQPAHERFLLMLSNYARLDFGESFFKGEKVIDLIIAKLPVSISLGLWSTLLIYLLAIPLGIYKAIHHGSRIDKLSAVLLAVGHAIPVFIFAILLLVFFAGGSYWQVFPLQGLVSENFYQLSALDKIKDYFWHLALPIITSTIAGFAGLTYLTKFSFMAELGKQYVLTAHAKGLSRRQVLYKHVFRNAMLIVISGLPSALIGIFFTTNFMVEYLFNLDGLGLLGFEAIQTRDYPVIFGTLFIFTLVGLLVQLLSDISYQLIDPRIDFDRA